MLFIIGTPEYCVRGIPDRLSTLLRTKNNGVAVTLQTCIRISAKSSDTLNENLEDYIGRWSERQKST
jgi:hypothetical protein